MDQLVDGIEISSWYVSRSGPNQGVYNPTENINVGKNVKQFMAGAVGKFNYILIS